MALQLLRFLRRVLFFFFVFGGAMQRVPSTTLAQRCHPTASQVLRRWNVPEYMSRSLRHTISDMRYPNPSKIDMDIWKFTVPEASAVVYDLTQGSTVQLAKDCKVCC
jgi:hypothetical protein